MTRGTEMYKYDLHALTADFTYGGRADISAEEAVEAHINAGYSGLVLTNPWGKKIFSDPSHEGKDIKQLAEEFLAAYEKIKTAAGNALDIFLGAEATVECANGNFLLYGITPEFLLEYEPDRADKDWFSDFASYVHSRGDVLIYQATPFAPWSVVVDFSEEKKERMADGLEVYNHRRADICCNHFAAARAAHYGVGAVSGSDLSYTGGGIGGGILTEEPIASNADLVAVLKNRKYFLASEENKNV